MLALVISPRSSVVSVLPLANLFSHGPQCQRLQRLPRPAPRSL